MYLERRDHATKHKERTNLFNSMDCLYDKITTDGEIMSCKGKCIHANPLDY